MNDNALIVALVLVCLLTAGDPDLIDAVISNLMQPACEAELQRMEGR